MASRPRRSGFERAGDLGVRELGLPAPRARELVLAQAWREVAGAQIARHAPALAVRRGVLEIGVPADGPWGRELPALLPDLAARLAAREPALGIVRLRFVDGAAVSGGPSRPLPTLDPRAPQPPAPIARRHAPRESGSARSVEAVASPERLQRVMEDYLACARAAPDHNE